MTTMKWTRADHRLASRIAARALREVFLPNKIPIDKLDIVMDLEGTHRDCPIDLRQLLEFPKGSFGHDLLGIYRHFDRRTGMLTECFTPRCSLPETPRDLSQRYYYPVAAAGEHGELIGRHHDVGEVRWRQDVTDGPLPPRFDLANHSPTGFAWGYGGSGPAQLALAILADVDGRDHVACRYYQRYKFEVIAGLKGLDWRIDARDVQEWLASQRLKEGK